MKSLEELATTKWANIEEVIPKIIIAKVEEAARTRRYGRGLVQINTDLTRTKGRSIIIPRSGTITAYSVAEGATPTETTYTVSSTTVTPTKIGVTIKITEEAISAAQLDIVRQSIKEAGIALADKEDLDVVNTLLGRTVATAETVDVVSGDGTTVTLDNAPLLIAPASIGGQNVTSVDYYDGKVVVAGSIATGVTITDYYYSTRTNYNDAATMQTLAYTDLVNVAGLIRAAKWAPDFVMCHPDERAALIKDARFIDVSQYGGAERITATGELGKISGMKVLVTTQMPTGVVLVLDTRRAAWFALRRNVELKRWDNPATDSIELYFYMEYGVVVSDENAIAISVNHASDAADL